MNSTKKYSRHIEIGSICIIMAAMALMLVGCSNEDDNPDSSQTGTIKGSVKDDNQNPYPNVQIIVSKGAETVTGSTNADGIYTINTKDTGSYSIEMEPPLSSEVITPNPTSINVLTNQPSPQDFVIKPKSVKAHLNFGNVQVLEEIKDKDGNTPVSPNEPLFAANIFDAPLGLLTPIMAPDGHQITLSEYKTAKGNLMVNCNGNKSTVAINLEGMIPNGTYTFWLAYLNKKRKVKEPIDFMNDFVHFTNPPIGSKSGTENILIADADGNINASLEHDSCILTDEVALVIPILYHINGKTFGGGHVPDPEEVAQMLAYFQ